MPLPEGFKTISPWPWGVDDDNAGSVFVLMDSALKSRYRYQPQHKVQLAEDLPDGKQLAEAVANANLFALAPDHALLLAAIVRGLVTVGTSIKIGLTDDNEPGWCLDDKPTRTLVAYPGGSEACALDPFGCPVLSDEARDAIVKALEA